MADATTTPEVMIIPANEASWEDLQAAFGTRGDPSRCQCQRYKMQPRESWASVGAEELAFRLREQTDCGHRESGTTSGLVAYLDGEPVGWCAVEPRTAYPRLLLKTRVPWAGRAEDKTDDGVWAVTCFVTRAGFRRRGISRALARATVDFARQRGARALEGYPMITQPGQEITLGRASCRQPQHFRRRRVRRGQSSDPPPGRDAHRLLTTHPMGRPATGQGAPVAGETRPAPAGAHSRPGREGDPRGGLSVDVVRTPVARR